MPWYFLKWKEATSAASLLILFFNWHLFCLSNGPWMDIWRTFFWMPMGKKKNQPMKRNTENFLYQTVLLFDMWFLLIFCTWEPMNYARVYWSNAMVLARMFYLLCSTYVHVSCASRLNLVLIPDWLKLATWIVFFHCIWYEAILSFMCMGCDNVSILFIRIQLSYPSLVSSNMPLQGWEKT